MMKNMAMKTMSLLIVLGITLTGCAATTASAKQGPPPAPVTVTRTPVVESHTFAAVGDSITAWAGNPQTWVSFAKADNLTLVGGWAHGGSKLEAMAANITPVHADVLIIMGGTNDLGDRWGTPVPARIASIKTIVEKSGAPRVILSAVPPLNYDPSWSNSWNVDLRHLAASMGWDFVDPWVPFRTADGYYVAGMTVDGIHPVPSVQKQVGVFMYYMVMRLL